jgi:hypothetical protein
MWWFLGSLTSHRLHGGSSITHPLYLLTTTGTLPRQIASAKDISKIMTGLELIK